MEHLQYPNESEAYRTARNALLDEEIALRAQIEAVADGWRGDAGLPVRTYRQKRHARESEDVRTVRTARHPDPLQLHVWPRAGTAVPRLHAPARRHRWRSAASWQHAAFHAVAKSPIARLAAWAHARGWEHMSLISTAGNSYDADYFGDTSQSQFSKGMRAQHKVPDGEDWDETIFNVFRKRDGKIRHFWGSEMAFAPPALNQNHRVGDLADPLWNLLDMTPEGRGAEWFPKVEY